MSKPSYLNFDIAQYAWKADINYRKEPEKYQVGKGEQGVLICEPYKSEILPFWRLKDPGSALKSSNKIFELFMEYLNQKDFVGADMVRKFLQMGFTRARHYTNYKEGRKYDAYNNYQNYKKVTGDPKKAENAAIFFKKWKEAESNPTYSLMKKDWKEKYG